MRTIPLFAAIVAAACAPPSSISRDDPGIAVSGEILARIAPGTRLPLGFVSEPLAVAGWSRIRYSSAGHPLAVARTLAALPGIEVAQPNWRYQPHAIPNDPQYNLQTAHQITDAEGGWDITTGSTSVIVAVLGSGIQLDHPDLDDNLWINLSELNGSDGVDDDSNGCIDDVFGCDFENDDGDPSGGDHETRVAGVIAAEGDNATGGAGVMWSAALMPVRIVLSSDQVARAIDYAVSNGAHVINMSFGIYLPQVFGGDSIVNDALLRAEAAGAVAVASAGNDSVYAPSYPAAHPLVLGVGGTNYSDERSGISNAGPWLDCAAPSVDMVTTSNGDQIVQVSGTSFAAPYVAGLAGLLRAQHSDWTAAEIREQIVFSGDKISPDRYLGYTRVNVNNALNDVRPAPMARLRRPGAGTVRGRGNIVVTGAAVGDSYELEWRPAGGSWTSLATGSETLDDELGHLDASGVALSEIELRLTVTAGSDTDTDQLSFHLGPQFLDGWPQETFGQVSSAPTYGDLDGNGSVELLVADTSNWVHGWEHDGTPLWFAPLYHSQSIPHTPALADLDGDGDIEIVTTARASTQVGGVYVWQHNDRDTEVWSLSTNRIYGVPVVTDLEGDGALEIIALEDRDGSSRVLVLTADGNYVTGWPVTVSDGGLASPVVADFDGDGAFDILVATDTEEILLHANGSYHSGWPRTINGAGSEPVAADFDGDGFAELVSVRADNVEIVDGDATVLNGWPQSIPSSSSRRVGLGDLDGDHTPEIVLGLQTGEVYAWHADGSVVSGWPQTTGDEIWAAPAIADLDGDGAVDVVISSTDGYVHAWSAAGVSLVDFPRPLHGSTSSSPAVGDFDGNGTLDLAVGGAELHWFLYAWELPAPFDPFTLEWSRARHDEANTAYYPKRFSLNGSGGGSTVTLSWSEPADIPAPAAYGVFRDGTRVATVTGTNYEDAPATSGTFTYGVVAIGDAGTTRARSMVMTVELTEADNPDPDDPITVTSSCACRSGAAPLGGLALLLWWRQRRRS